MKQINQSPLKAFIDAFNGLKYFFLHERNGKIQLAIAVMAILLAVYVGASAGEWIVILLCIGIVLSLEMMNTAVEKLCDVVQEDYHPFIKIIKDVAASAVLWSSIVSAIIGAIIFIPKLLSIL
jgi:diacylglycerol kinase